MKIPFRTFEPGVLMGGWQSGDDIPDSFYDLVPTAQNGFRSGDATDRPAGHRSGPVPFYRELMRLPGRYLWIVSQRQLDVGFVHDWIYRSRQRAEEQWDRTLAASPLESGAQRSAAAAEKHPARSVTICHSTLHTGRCSSTQGCRGRASPTSSGASKQAAQQRYG